MIKVGIDAVSCHDRFHKFECKVHFLFPLENFVARLGGKQSNVSALGPHILVMSNSTKKARHLLQFF